MRKLKFGMVGGDENLDYYNTKKHPVITSIMYLANLSMIK